MRTVSSLLGSNDRVFVYLASPNLSALFFRNAEAEGFSFPGGAKPTSAQHTDVIVILSDWTIRNLTGWAGHMAYHNPGAVIRGPWLRVNYGKYVSGSNSYFF